jgi:hypothetical protein
LEKINNNLKTKQEMKKLLYKLIFNKKERKIIEDAVRYSSYKYEQHEQPEKCVEVDEVFVKLLSLQ